MNEHQLIICELKSLISLVYPSGSTFSRRCDQPGCSFATREARYIHFHKFYRHRIPLPAIIGIDDRQCPFCKHIAKSPSMLDKHLSRHLPECTRDGRLFCSVCDFFHLSFICASQFSKYVWLWMIALKNCFQSYAGNLAGNVKSFNMKSSIYTTIDI